MKIIIIFINLKNYLFCKTLIKWIKEIMIKIRANQF